MLETRALEFDLPERLIARCPVEPRDASRLLVVSRTDRARLEHRRFHELPEILRRGDRLVLNTTRVLPARLVGRRSETGGRVEGLFLHAEGPTWSVALRSNSRLRAGLRIDLDGRDGSKSGWSLTLERKEADHWIAEIGGSDSGDHCGAPDVLREIGLPPLPPYIRGARRRACEPLEDERDDQWYQTIYGRTDQAGSVAAPTAGLHFTETVLERLRQAGIARSEITLHVGPGTFKPIETEQVEMHPMHEEQVEVPAQTVGGILETKASGGRVVCVGTTSVRALESLPRPLLDVVVARGWQGSTRLLISPGFEPVLTDAMVTNFHLPRSTLLALVAALLEGGVDRLKEIYRVAVREEYRFFSYGDAMLILP